MKKIYLDISSITNEYFIQYIKNMKVKLYISELTILELKSYRLYNGEDNFNKIDEFVSNIEVLKITNTVLNRAKLYLKMKIIENEKYNDALHIALAKTYNCDTILYDSNILKEKNIELKRLGCNVI